MSLTDQLVQYLVTGVSVGVVYGLVGLGITIIFNATGVINFAQGEFVMRGGMCAVAFVGLGIPLIVALVLSVVVVSLWVMVWVSDSESRITPMSQSGRGSVRR